MKPLLIILSLAILAFSVWWLSSSSFSPPPAAPLVSNQETPPVSSDFHPYSINSLSAKVKTKNLITIEKEFPKQPGFTSYLVSYLSEDLKLYALLNLPDGQKPADGWPVIVVNHGYIEPTVYSTQNSYKNTSAYYARQGFLVLKPDYRGHAQSAGNPTPPLSRLQYAVDVLNLIEGIDSLSDADPENIFLYGHSLGGDLSLVIVENSHRIKAASLWAPAVTDFPESVAFFARKRRVNTPQFEQLKLETDKLIEQYGASSFSSLSQVSKVNSPLIIHHGTADESVPYSWGLALNKALQDAGKSVTFHTYTGANHDIAQSWSTALSRDLAFFRSHLER